MLYVATSRVSFVVVGLIAFAIGAWYLGDAHPAHPRPGRGLAAPVRPARSTTRPVGSFQIANRLFAQAAGGLFGQGFGQAILTMPRATRCSRSRRPT